MPAADSKEKVLKQTLSPGDSHLFDTFDACDSLTAVRDELAGALTDGFLALARERYRDPNAHLRKFFEFTTHSTVEPKGFMRFCFTVKF